jgi:hypothetical protein
LKKIQKRELFYLPGYDPRGTRYYYNLYKKGTAQEAQKGNIFQVSKRERTQNYLTSWKVQFEQTETSYNFLEWDDIIRNRWTKNTFEILIDLLYIIQFYVFNGTIITYAKASPAQLIAAFYPVVYIFFSLFISMFISSQIFMQITHINIYFASFISILIMWFLLSLTIKIGDKFAVFWLLRIYVFAVDYTYKENDELDMRLDIFADYIVKSLEKRDNHKIDEVIIVAHSVGTILVIPLLEKILKKIEYLDNHKIPVLTLGECIPIVSFLPEAKEFREKMKQVIQSNSFEWVDYTTPIDGACFPLLDFYKHSNINVDEDKKPQYLSPRFHILFSNKEYKKIKRNRYLTHFIYLMSSEYDKGYNFFKITAGNKSFIENIR